MKTVVIGTGRMGRRHIEVVRSLGLDLTGVCDARPESLQLAVTEQSVSQDLLFTNTTNMMTQVRPECVIIATTAPSHCELVGIAANEGARFILCEKPMAVSLAECDRMIEVCQARGVHLAINHQMRFMEQYTRPKALLQSDAYGGLASVTVVAGNFGLAMNGTHYYEMFRFLTDEYPASATGWFSDVEIQNPRGPQFKDRSGSVRLTTPSGRRFYLEAGDDQGHGLRVVYSARNGQIVVDELTGRMETVVREAEHRALPTTRYGMPAISEVHQIAPQSVIAPSADVLRALLDGGIHDSPTEGRSAVAALVAAYISNESGHRAVDINDALPRDRIFPWA